MVLIKHTFLKKIVVILTLFMILLSFVVSPGAEAAGAKTQMKEGEFYYAGTTEGAYVVVQNFWDWLIEMLGQILDFLLGLMTMGGRMVFVGWAALIEEAVTGLLEATTGIPMEIESSVDPTNVDGLISSSNNVTIEAIVYNQVPILDINVFDIASSTCVSGTGNFFVECEDCYNKQQEEIKKQAEEEAEARGETVSPTAKPTSEIVKSVRPVARKEKICKMVKCECQECWKKLANQGYFEKDSSGAVLLDADGQPVRKANAITVIKDSVSKWYYIMRLIAIMVMLCVLIAVGVKMAVSTIASDKALYKRMLVDWIVGMILLFTIHYFMIGIINLNELMVDFIEKSSRTTSAELGKEFGGEDKDNAEMEVGIYQAVRSRAYDPKLINGTTGTVLYVTLVFYTIKFVIIYLKRYLTLIILTLMAPGVGFSYAIQKVMFGKSKAFGTWLHEYFVNVFIQTVHALVYTVFVTTALEISLNSVSGMILAFIFINFMLKADDMFRKIFKLAGTSTDDAMNADKALKQTIKSAKSAATFMAAGSLLNKTPIAKAVRAPLKAAGTGVLLGASRIKHAYDNRESVKEKREQANLDKNNRLESMMNELKDLRSAIDPGGSATEDFKKYMDDYNPEEHAVGLDGQDAMEKELVELEKLAAARNISDKNKAKLADLRKRFDKDTVMTTGKVMKAKIGKLLDASNYYDYNEKGELRLKRNALFGKVRFDRTKDKYVRESMSDLVREQFFPSTKVGISEAEKKRIEADKKMIKEVLGFGRDTLVGMGSLFVGVGTIVSNPAVGMGLLATGINSRINYLEQTGQLDTSRLYRKPTVDEKHKKYSFNRFNKGAKQTISNSILSTAEKDKDKVVVENVRKNHSKLYKTLRLGGVGLVVAGAFGMAPVAIAGGAATICVAKNIQRYSGYSQNSLLGKLSRHHFKQYEALKKELIEDEIGMLSAEEEQEFKENYTSVLGQIDKMFEDDKEATPEEKEQRMMEEALALKREEAVKLESGEVLVLNNQEKDTSKLLTKDGILKEDIERDFIEEAVSKAIIDVALNSSGIDSFSEENISKEAKEQITKKLESYGILDGADAKVESLIQDLDKKIDKTIDKITKQELGGSYDEKHSSTVENSDSNVSESASTDTTKVKSKNRTNNTNATQKQSRKNNEEQSSEKLSKFDEVLIETVIKDKAESGEIGSMSEVSAAMITEAVTELKAKVVAKKSSDDVVKKMQQARDDLKPKDTTSTQNKSRNTQTEPQKTEPKDTSYESVSKVSKEKQDLIKNKISEIKKQNNTTHLKSEEERREDKKKKIEALDALLTAEAMGEDKVYTSENEEVYKSADEIIQELFDNTEQQTEVYEMLSNVSEMKRLNRRAANANIGSNNSKYNKAKKEEDLSKYIDKDPNQISNGDNVYTNGDGRKDLAAKEVYGPITDVDSVLKDIKKRRNYN